MGTLTSDGKWHKIWIYSSIDGGCNNDKWFANGVGAVGGWMGTLFSGEWVHFDVKMISDGKWHKMLIYN